MAGIRFYSRGMSTRHIRIGVLEPKPHVEDLPIVFRLPVWTIQSDLGEFQSGDEVSIIMNYTDVDNVIDGFVLTGTLPKGLLFNTLDGSISGFIEETTSKEFSFNIAIRTIQNNFVQQRFTMNTTAYTSQIVWDTPENLGVYNTGDTVNRSINAYSETLKS